MELRPYQEEAIQAVHSSLKRNITRQLIHLPTGCGKTVLFCSLLDDLRLRGIVIAHRDELLSQSKETALKCKSVNTPFILGKEQPTNSHTIISSIQTAIQPKRLEYLREFDPEVIVIDEAHHAVAPSYIKLLLELGFINSQKLQAHSQERGMTLFESYLEITTGIKKKKEDFDPEFYSQKTLILGLTATPTRADGYGLGRLFEDCIYTKNLFDMIELGYLCPIKSMQVKTGIKFDWRPQTEYYEHKTILPSASDQGARDEQDLTEKHLAAVAICNERNELIIKSYLEHCKDRNHTLVFCCNVEHATSLADMFNKNGIPASASFGSMKEDERKQNLDDFASGKIKVLTNCNLYTEGFDCPQVDCILMARPTKSSALYTQCIGRGTRKHAGKEDCLILDYRDDVAAVVCTFSTLDDRKKKTVNEKFLKKNEESEDGFLPQEQPEQAKVESDGTLHYKELNLNNSPSWYRLPVTQHQINCISRYYKECTFDFEAMTRKQASELISKIENINEITPKQKSLLKWKKYPQYDTLDKKKASKVIEKIQQGKPFCPICGSFSFDLENEFCYWCDTCDSEEQHYVDCQCCGRECEYNELYCITCSNKY